MSHGLGPSGLFVSRTSGHSVVSDGKSGPDKLNRELTFFRELKVWERFVPSPAGSIQNSADVIKTPAE